jgi:uncharacterized protein with PhoU and TrkA domain
MVAEEVRYEPVSVKAVLAEMKDTAELLIDLSYSAVLGDSDALAEEVLELEARMDLLQMQGRMSVLLAARNPEDAEALAPVLGVIAAAEKVSNAAGDIAKIVLEEIGMPPAIRGGLHDATETVIRTRAAAAAPAVGVPLGTSHLETETGVRVIAIRRESAVQKQQWLLNPGADTTVEADDVLLLRGQDAGLTAAVAAVGDAAFTPPSRPDGSVPDLERAVDSIVLMKDMSELAVDLAYGAVLFDSQPVAEEVSELEVEMDALKSRLEAWALRAAAAVEEPVELRGLFHLAAATEVISDAALEMRGIDAHPVVAAAVQESDEVIIRAEVGGDATLAGRSLGEQAVQTETGMRVIAVRRPAGWVVQPDATTTVAAGDVLIAKGTRAGAERLRALVDHPDGS